jgi:hypothetical protein
MPQVQSKQIAIIVTDDNGKKEEFLFESYEAASQKITEIGASGDVKVDVEYFDNFVLSEDEINEIFEKVEAEFEAEEREEREKEIAYLEKKLKTFKRHGGCTNRTREYEGIYHRLQELKSMQ